MEEEVVTADDWDDDNDDDDDDAVHGLVVVVVGIQAKETDKWSRFSISSGANTMLQTVRPVVVLGLWMIRRRRRWIKMTRQHRPVVDVDKEEARLPSTALSPAARKTTEAETNRPS
jgi:hypothetical protein